MSMSLNERKNYIRMINHLISENEELKNKLEQCLIEKHINQQEKKKP